MGSNPRAISIHSCELLGAERKNLILSPKEGGSRGSFRRPRLCSRSQIFFPKAVGNWEGGPFDVTF